MILTLIRQHVESVFVFVVVCLLVFVVDCVKLLYRNRPTDSQSQLLSHARTHTHTELYIRAMGLKKRVLKRERFSKKT